MLRRTDSRSRQGGFTIVELMVGVTVALIALVLWEQVVIGFDSQKRLSSGVSEAQNTGMIAMHSLEADIRQAGYGLASLSALYCTLDTALNINGRPFVPVMIIPAGMSRTDAANVLQIPPGDAGSDAIAVMYSDNPTTVEGEVILSSASSGGSTVITFERNVAGFRAAGGGTPGDNVLVAQAGQPCMIGVVTAVDSAGRTLTVDRAPTTATFGANSARVFNLGPGGLTARVYAVRGGNLTVCNFAAANCATDLTTLSQAQINALWVPIAGNVAGLRAQYGWDTTAVADMAVDTYCRDRLTPGAANCPTGSTPATPLPNTACDWTRITSLRLGLVVRSVERRAGEENVTATTIKLWQDSTNPVTTGPDFTVPSQQYRYRTFETSIPVRNTIWLGAQTSCT